MTVELALEPTPIPGLLVLHLPLHHDDRGWFKENWQREKMTALGLPDFGPVQNNISFNTTRGVTRGIHAEPWDKLVSVAAGRVFAAWVDLREGPTFGTCHHRELDPGVSVFVPRGVGNAYQTLEDATSYSYLVNQHWRAGLHYPALALDDGRARIPWPIPLTGAVISAKDRDNPRLDQITPMRPLKTLIIGSRGQLGRALAAEFPQATQVDLDTFDITDPATVRAWPWHEYDVVLNAAAHTAVDAAESPEGRASVWATNASAPAALAAAARDHHLTLVHYSTDYVFDGTRSHHVEDEPFSPLGVYGQTKAAGDLAVATAPRHYILRTSWVVGDGHNFVRTMARLATDGVAPRVVDDQVGRLTFTDELARATRHLLETRPPYGTYHCTNSGEPASWASIARLVFELCGRKGGDVTPVSTADYAADRGLAPRPAHSTLDLTKLEETGFRPEDALEALTRYLEQLDTGAGP